MDNKFDLKKKDIWHTPRSDDKGQDKGEAMKVLGWVEYEPL